MEGGCVKLTLGLLLANVHESRVGLESLEPLLSLGGLLLVLVDLGLVALELGVEEGLVLGVIDHLLHALHTAAGLLVLLLGAEGGQGGVLLQGLEGGLALLGLLLEVIGLGGVVLGDLVQERVVASNLLEALQAVHLTALALLLAVGGVLAALGHQRRVVLERLELGLGLLGLVLDVVGLGRVVLGDLVEERLVAGDLLQALELEHLVAHGLGRHGLAILLVGGHGHVGHVGLCGGGAGDGEEDDVEQLHVCGFFFVFGETLNKRRGEKRGSTKVTIEKNRAGGMYICKN